MRTFIATLLCGALTLTGQGLAGRRAPSFSLPDSNNIQHDILDYRGKWLVMTYTTSNGSCPHCAPLAKALEPLQTKVAVLNVMLPPENYTSAAKFIADNKITSPIVF